jgi:hypothetical protein
LFDKKISKGRETVIVLVNENVAKIDQRNRDLLVAKSTFVLERDTAVA